MENIDKKEIALNDQIKKLHNAIDHERKLYFKHLRKCQSLRREIAPLYNQLVILFPERYTKRGDLRKRYKDKF